MEAWGHPKSPVVETLKASGGTWGTAAAADYRKAERISYLVPAIPMPDWYLWVKDRDMKRIKGVSPLWAQQDRLLTKIIEAMNYTREQVYICNIIKCRPPENRNPMPDEIQACSPFLRRQIASIKPDIHCALGDFCRPDTP